MFQVAPPHNQRDSLKHTHQLRLSKYSGGGHWKGQANKSFVWTLQGCHEGCIYNQKNKVLFYVLSPSWSILHVTKHRTKRSENKLLLVSAYTHAHIVCGSAILKKLVFWKHLLFIYIYVFKYCYFLLVCVCVCFILTKSWSFFVILWYLNECAWHHDRFLVQ